MNDANTIRDALDYVAMQQEVHRSALAALDRLEAEVRQQLDDAEFANNAARSVLKGYLIEHDYVVQRVSRDRTAACVCWTCRRARSVLGLPEGIPIWPKAVSL